jgi:hypothetical protein
MVYDPMAALRPQGWNVQTRVPKGRRDRLELAIEKAVAPVLERRRQFEAINANYTPKRGDQRIPGMTPQEVEADQAAKRAEYKRGAHERFETQTKAAIREANELHRMLLAEVDRDIEREQNAVRERYDERALEAEQARLRAEFASPSASLLPDLGARLTAAWDRADALGREAIRREFAAVAGKAATDPAGDRDGGGTDHRLLRQLHYAIKTHAEANGARLAELRAEREDLAAQGPRIVGVTQDAQVEFGRGPKLMGERGEWEVELLGLRRFPEDAIVLPPEPQEPAAPPPEAALEKSADRMGRLYGGGAGVAVDEGHPAPAGESSNGDGPD